jgi:hypothetical protein
VTCRFFLIETFLDDFGTIPDKKGEIETSEKGKEQEKDEIRDGVCPGISMNYQERRD